jgi:hypothetical protein
MGGLAGHMSHLWEDLDITFKELEQILSEASSGTLEAAEKFDGINIFFTVDSQSRLRFARNQTHVQMGGLLKNEAINLFHNHPARDQFVNGIHAICEINKVGWWPLGFAKKNWVNSEIVYAKKPQTIRYSRNAIVLHEAVALTSTGKQMGIDVSDKFEKLVESAENYEVLANNQTWTFHGPQRVSLENICGQGDLSAVLEKLTKIRESADLKREDTLRDWAFVSLVNGTLNQLRISEQRKLRLASLMLDLPESKNDRLIDIKKGLSKTTASAVSAIGAKKNRSRVMSETMRPLEIVVGQLGAAVLENHCSALVDDPLTETTRLHEEYDSCVVIAESTDDGFLSQRMNLMNEYQNTLGAIGRMPPAMEGLVFSWGDKKYKLTGAYGVFNQIVGLARYGRGNIPPIASEKALNEMQKQVEMIKQMGLI